MSCPTCSATCRTVCRQRCASSSSQWHALEAQIDRHTEDVELIAKRNDDCWRLVTIPGIGPLGAIAIIAAIGNGAMFTKGR